MILFKRKLMNKFKEINRINNQQVFLNQNKLWCDKGLKLGYTLLPWKWSGLCEFDYKRHFITVLNGNTDQHRAQTLWNFYWKGIFNEFNPRLNRKHCLCKIWIEFNCENGFIYFSMYKLSGPSVLSYSRMLCNENDCESYVNNFNAGNTA